MRRSDDGRRAASARSYVAAARAQSALRTTVVLAAELLGYPIGQVNILDSDTQHTLASVGPREYGAIGRAEALCDQVITTGASVVHDDLVTGARRHPEFGAYVGVPLEGREGTVVGTLCLMDLVPRPIPPSDVEHLAQFALVVQEQLDLARRAGVATRDGVRVTRDLAAAIDSGQVRPWFQPIVDLATGAVTGYEALARWDHPQLGVVPPLAFIPHAEDTDLVVDLDLAVTTAALAEAQRWWARDPSVGLSINISGYHVADPRSLARYEEVARAAGAAPGALTLEVTETAALPDGNRATAAVQRLQDAGFRVVLDDFGTAWASLEQLLVLPVDGVKLDHAVAAALDSAAGTAITRAVVGLAGDLGLATVLEGVETAEQARRARDLGLRSGQGFLFGAPVSPEDLPHRRAAG